MKRAGRRYPLLMYTRMLDRWWPALFFLGLALLALAWPFYRDLYVRLTQPWRWTTFTGLGGIVILVSLLMLALRKSAYVQPFGSYLRLVTPFLRLNISYRRIRSTTTTAMAMLFPLDSLRGMRRDIVRPLLSRTAVVVDMNALPMSVRTLRLFLSPFFFKDRTPHLVILVDDWMGFSTELESRRMAGAEPVLPPRRAPSSLLGQLPRK
jgi:hypothetical protein